jgi:hypothetical protein
MKYFDALASCDSRGRAKTSLNWGAAVVSAASQSRTHVAHMSQSQVQSKRRSCFLFHHAFLQTRQKYAKTSWRMSVLTPSCSRGLSLPSLTATLQLHAM